MLRLLYAKSPLFLAPVVTPLHLIKVCTALLSSTLRSSTRPAAPVFPVRNGPFSTTPASPTTRSYFPGRSRGHILCPSRAITPHHHYIIHGEWTQRCASATSFPILTSHAICGVIENRYEVHGSVPPFCSINQYSFDFLSSSSSVSVCEIGSLQLSHR